MNKLFRSIEILNDKSLTVLMDNTRSNLWILRHFKDLTISNKNICYQVNNGHRQRKNTKHPYRWMRKKFSNTAEFLDYLDTKAYDIHYIEFEFTNGWHIKETSNAFIDFHTNSIQVRDELQKKLLEIGAQN